MSDRNTYWNYLKLDTLLNLQNGIEGSQVSVDEMHFIVVHQVFELWFKLILVELRLGRDKLATAVVQEETIPYVVHHLRRISEILRVAASHWKVVETLAPQDFLEFRSKLGTASGFQSFQLRELETVLGLEPSQRKKHGHPDPLDMLLETLENDNSNQGKKNKIKIRICPHGVEF